LFEQTTDAVNRSRACRRLRSSSTTGMCFERDAVPLADLVSGALHLNELGGDGVKELGKRMGELRYRDDLPNDAKLAILEFELGKVAGPRVVRIAVRTLRRMRMEECRYPPESVQLPGVVERVDLTET
jgi:hypothetical protein